MHEKHNASLDRLIEHDPDRLEQLLEEFNTHDAALRRIAELEARLVAVVAGAILPADAVDEFFADGVRWVRVPAEATVTFRRSQD